MKALLTLMALLVAGAASAQAVDESVRPTARADTAGVLTVQSQPRAEWFIVPPSVQAVANSRRPRQRTPAAREVATEQASALAAGAVCGDIALQGERLGNYSGPGACGVEDAVRLRSVAGIPLSTSAIVDCTTARAFRSWVDTGLIPSVGREGGGVALIRIVSHYACRARNNQSGGRLSEHGKGRAIDIAGIGLKSGREIMVLTGWNTVDDGPILRRMWRAACGPFGTVLGPQADRFHRDHFHFDTAQYRSGSYCR